MHAVIKEAIMTEVWGLGAGNTATKNLERQRRSRQSDLIKNKRKQKEINQRT